MQRISAYKHTEIYSSDNIRVISLLFDGAVNFLKMARVRLEQGDIAGKGLYIGKATSIVGEFMSSLDMEKGGEIAVNLERLYDFIIDRLVTANLNNDLKAFDEAERVLETLRSAWKEMEQTTREKTARQSAEQNHAVLGLRA